jgi:hypothetical protein
MSRHLGERGGGGGGGHFVSWAGRVCQLSGVELSQLSRPTELQARGCEGELLTGPEP